MQQADPRALHWPVLNRVARYVFDHMSRMRELVGPDPARALVISALGWSTGQHTLPQPGETEDEAERLLAIRTPAPAASLPPRTGLTEQAVRRALASLEADGHVLSGPDGYLVTPPLLHGPAMERLRRRVFVSVTEFVAELAALGVELPRTPVAAHETRRRVARLSMRFVLDGWLPELMRTLGWDARKALMFMALCAADGDDAQEGLTRHALSRDLAMSPAAVRGAVEGLLAEGWLETRGRSGLIVPASVLAAAPIEDAALRTWQATADFLRDLNRVGVPMPRLVRGARAVAPVVVADL